MPHFRAMRVRTVADAARRDAAAERRAQWEREDGIPDRGPDDCRTPIALDLSAAGGPRLTLHPVRRGGQGFPHYTPPFEGFRVARNPRIVHSIGSAVQPTRAPGSGREN